MAPGHRRFIGRVIAGIAALSVVFILLLGPLTLYRLIVGEPMNGPGAEWEIWLVVGGGALGAGAGRLVHHCLLTQVFRFSETEETQAWQGRS